MFSFPENCKYVLATAPRTGAGAAVNATPVSLKNVHKLWAVCTVNTVGTSAAVALVPQTDTLVAFASAAVLTTAVRIWVNADVATNGDQLTEATAAVNYTTVADALTKVVIFEIDPADLTAGEDCFRMSITALAATDFACIEYVILPRYQGRVSMQPTVITD